ncbi:MAG: Rab family GTPase [Candidatus Hodarchaeales archaeon]
MPDEYLFKICAIGSPNTCKTALIRRFVEGKFTTDYLPSLGVDITTKQVQVDDNNIKLILVDTAGQEFFGKLRPSYYSGTSACLIFCSLKDRTSINNVSNYLLEFRKHVSCPSVPITLVAVREIQTKDRDFKNGAKKKIKVESLLRKFLQKKRIGYFRKLFRGKRTADEEARNLAKKLGINFCLVNMSDPAALEKCIFRLLNELLL